MAKTKCSLKDVIKISTLLTSLVRVSVLEGPVGLSRRKYFHFWHLLKLTFTFTKYLLHWHYLDTRASCTQTPQGTNGDIAFIERTSVYLSVVLDWNPLLSTTVPVKWATFYSALSSDRKVLSFTSHFLKSRQYFTEMFLYFLLTDRDAKLRVPAVSRHPVARVAKFGSHQFTFIHQTCPDLSSPRTPTKLGQFFSQNVKIKI